MYPFESVAWAWDELWAAVHRRAPWTPDRLIRSGDAHARWDDPECVVTQVCGGPFAAVYRDDMNLVASFSLDLPEADLGTYRSVLLSPNEVGLDELTSPDTHAVANSADSLSGWLSLLAVTVGAGNEWPGTVAYTSAHVDSVRALARGEADLASVDSWSLAFIADEEPELLANLHRVGLGPSVPTPAIAARKSVTPARLADLQGAFREALDDESTRAARGALHIAGLAGNTLDDYLSTLTLRAA